VTPSGAAPQQLRQSATEPLRSSFWYQCSKNGTPVYANSTVPIALPIQARRVSAPWLGSVKHPTSPMTYGPSCAQFLLHVGSSRKWMSNDNTFVLHTHAHALMDREIRACEANRACSSNRGCRGTRSLATPCNNRHARCVLA
jgi:hypothetical protein